MGKRGIQLISDTFTHRIISAGTTIISNKIKFGIRAPKRKELIYIDPNDITGHLSPKIKKELFYKTGLNCAAIVNGNWDLKTQNVDFKNKTVFESCYMHWVEGIPWRQTPTYKHYEQLLRKGEPNYFDSIKELKSRYHKLDLIYYEVLKKRKMSTNIEDLVIINIRSDGSLIWGPDGRHRICIAMIANLEFMPALIGYVHPNGLDKFQTLRKTNSGN